MPKIKCKICNKEMKHITNTHLKQHNMSINDYKTMFPNTPMISKEILEKKDTSPYIDYKKVSITVSKTKQRADEKNLGKKIRHLKIGA